MKSELELFSVGLSTKSNGKRQLNLP